MLGSTIAKTKTEIPGLDEMTFGGLPAGRATLVIGRSGTWKTILCLQLACHVARTDAVLYFTLEEGTEDLRTVGRDLEFEVDASLDGGRLRIVELMPPAEHASLAGNVEIDGMMSNIIKAAERAQAKMVVIDSITAMFSAYGLGALARRALYSLASSFARLGITLVVTAESRDDYAQAQSLAAEDYVCDLVVFLRNVVDGKRRRHSIEVQKYRRSPHLKGEFPLALTDQGLVVFPLDVEEEDNDVGALDADALAPTERFPSGVPGLDALTGGGWLRDSTTLVRGPTGSGKTVLAGIYAITGALRGEHVFYFGFEETREALLRNWATLGLDVKPAIASGALKVISRFPESTSIEDLIIELRRVLADHEPSLIVIDSISSIEHSTSPELFRQFIVGLTSSLRQHGRSALLTQAVPEETVYTDGPFVSTMTDAIVVLGYRTQPASLERTVRVLKMRGSAHELGEHVLEIREGGVEITRRL